MDRSCRLLHGQPRQPFEWNYFPLLTGRIVLSNKKRNLRRYSVVCFFKDFPKKNVFGGPCIYNCSLQSLVRLTILCLTPLLLDVLILYMSGGTYSLKSTPDDRFLRSFSLQFYLFAEFLAEICWEEVAEEIFFSISFC